MKIYQRVKKDSNAVKIFCNRIYMEANPPVKFNWEKYELTYKFKL